MERGGGEKSLIEVVGIEKDSLQGSDWNQRLANNHHSNHNSNRSHRHHSHQHPPSFQFQELLQTEEVFENNRPPIPCRTHHRSTNHHTNHHPSRRPIRIEEYPARSRAFREEEEIEEDNEDFAMKKVVQSAVPSSFIHYRYYKNGGSSSSPRVWSPNASASSSTTSTSLGTTTTACEAVIRPGHYNVKGTHSQLLFLTLILHPFTNLSSLFTYYSLFFFTHLNDHQEQVKNRKRHNSFFQQLLLLPSLLPFLPSP